MIKINNSQDNLRRSSIGLKPSGSQRSIISIQMLNKSKLQTPKQKRSSNPSFSETKDPLQTEITKVFTKNSPQELLLQVLRKNKKQQATNGLQYLIQSPSKPQTRKTQQKIENMVSIIDDKKLTVLNFGFKSHEKRDNFYIKPLKRVANNDQTSGSMFVSDLWSEKNINKMLGRLEISRDNYLLKKFGQVCERKKKYQTLVKTRQENSAAILSKLQKSQADDFVLHKKKLFQDQDTKIKRLQSKQTISSSNFIKENQEFNDLIEMIDDAHDQNTELYGHLNQTIENFSRGRRKFNYILSTIVK